jgi:predicted negative regulator of RcsB-dependent stress response
MEGQIDAGIKQLQAGYDGFVSTGARLFIPYFTALKAELYARGGQFDQAVAALEEAGTQHSANSEGWFAANFHRMSGDLYRKMDLTSRAEAAYHAGLELARVNDDLLNQLRCTMGLAELAQSSVDKQSMRHKLVEVVSRFSQGSTMADIRRAKEVIELL